MQTLIALGLLLLSTTASEARVWPLAGHAAEVRAAWSTAPACPRRFARRHLDRVVTVIAVGSASEHYGIRRKVHGRYRLCWVKRSATGVSVGTAMTSWFEAVGMMEALAAMQFHGVALGFGCFDGSGEERIAPGGVATCVGEVLNLDDFGHSMRVDIVSARYDHTDGTGQGFAQAFPGPSTVIPGEAKQVIVLVRAKLTDAGDVGITISIDGHDLGTGLPFSGEWGVSLHVVAP